MRFVLATLIVLLTIGICSAALSISTPSGSISGNVGTSYGYYTKAIDSNGYSVKYTFDWGDGTFSTSPLMMSGASIKMFHKWSTAGTYSLRTKATNTAGMSSAWSPSLQVVIGGGVTPPVNNPPSTPSVPSGSASGISGTVYSYSTKATDPDGNQVKYTFDWGDGTTSTTSLVSSGTLASASHSWIVSPGTTNAFSVKAKATDEYGAVSGWSSAASVTITGPIVTTNKPPATAYTPWGPLVGKTKYSYTYETMATDPDKDRVKYIFDWGDGTTSTTGYVESGVWAKATHQWTLPAGTSKSFSTRAKAIDEHGAEGPWSIVTYVIMRAEWINYPPTVPSVNGPSTGKSGVPCEFSFRSNDTDSHYIKYVIYWGNKITETGYFPSGQTVKIPYTWNVPAGQTYKYSVKAMAIDSYGMPCDEAWSAPATISISGPPVMMSLSPALEVDENMIIDPNTEEYNSNDMDINESEYENVSSSEA